VSVHFEKADPALPACAVCDCHELYKKKDFPHWLGLNLLILAFIASAMVLVTLVVLGGIEKRFLDPEHSDDDYRP